MAKDRIKGKGQGNEESRFDEWLDFGKCTLNSEHASSFIAMCYILIYNNVFLITVYTE